MKFEDERVFRNVQWNIRAQKVVGRGVAQRVMHLVGVDRCSFKDCMLLENLARMACALKFKVKGRVLDMM